MPPFAGALGASLMHLPASAARTTVREGGPAQLFPPASVQQALLRDPSASSSSDEHGSDPNSSASDASSSGYVGGGEGGNSSTRQQGSDASGHAATATPAPALAVAGGALGGAQGALLHHHSLGQHSRAHARVSMHPESLGAQHTVRVMGELAAKMLRAWRADVLALHARKAQVWIWSHPPELRAVLSGMAAKMRRPDAGVHGSASKGGIVLHIQRQQQQQQWQRLLRSACMSPVSPPSDIRVLKELVWDAAYALATSPLAACIQVCVCVCVLHLARCTCPPPPPYLHSVCAGHFAPDGTHPGASYYTHTHSTQPS